MQSLTVLLKDKEESLRKSKELLRKSQQEGEESGKKMELDPSWQALFEMNCNQVSGVNGGHVGSSPAGSTAV